MALFGRKDEDKVPLPPPELMKKKKKKAKKKPKPKVVKKAPKSPQELKDVTKRINRIERVVSTLSSDLKVLSREIKDYRKLPKKVNELFKDLDTYKGELIHEIRSINKQLGPIYDKENANTTKLKTLETTSDDLGKDIERLNRGLKGVKQIIKGVESAFNKKAMESLSNRLDIATKSLKKIENTHTAFVTNLNKVDKKITTIEKSSVDASIVGRKAELLAADLNNRAQELRAMVDGYTKQIAVLNSKLNSNINSIMELGQVSASARSRMDFVEQRLAVLDDLRALLDKNIKVLGDVAKKVDYLEKVAVKTIVLD